MTQQIFIYLANGVAPSWVILAAGQVVTTVWQRDATQLPRDSDAEITLVVPQEDVLLTSVSLPKMSQHRLRQALPFALEEQLIAELSQLHVAHGVPRTGEPLAVAVVAHAKMQQWLAQCREWGVIPQRVIAAAHLLPVTQDAWHVWHTELAIVRTDAHLGFACDQANCAMYLDALLAQMSPPSCVHVFQSATDAVSLPPAMVSFAQIQSMSASQAFANFALAHQPNAALNLLQPPYAPVATRKLGVLKMKRLLLGLACTWLLMLFAYPIVDQVILKQRVTQLDQAVAQLYRQYFPQASSVVAPQHRLEEKRRELQAAQSENHVLLLLAQLGEAIKQVPGVRLHHIDYQAKQLSLQLSANTSETLTALSNVLQTQGLQVHQQNADVTDNSINATMQIE